MGKSRRANDGSDQQDEGDFELYAEDVWEDDESGRFAKARWSEGPRRRRSQWLRQQLDLATSGGDTELSRFSRRG